ncbi:MAG: hypothetical protein NDI60_03950 [Elusimicrobiales bacterium]|nr:hypothetical protein [Elusimicrobiales bacterium]
MNILGISCYYHDSAACLVKDGRVVAAAQEERFSRRKNDPDLPLSALNYCLQAGDITMDALDRVVFYEKPFLKFSRVLLGHVQAWPRSFGSFMSSMPLWLGERLTLPLTLKEKTGYSGRTHFIKHHLSHAAAAFLPSPFEEAAILTADGVGEWATTTRGRGAGSGITIDGEISFPDSLGLLYTAVTVFLGFEANEGEGKVMGLASCGQPSFMKEFSRLAEVKDDGSYRLDPGMFDFYGGRMYSPAFTRLFGEPRKPGGELTDRHRDIAASLQKFTEDVLLRLARDLHARTGSRNLCLAGGVALNCVTNHKILEETPFRAIFVQPAAGDAGGALGAACYGYNCLSGRPRGFVMDNALLGPEYTERQIELALAREGLKAEKLPDELLFKRTAALLAAGKVTGWFQGRMEFGPRALGARSLLGDPRNPKMKDILNSRVKHREPFRPYASAVTAERAQEYFDLRAPSPFMLLAPRTRAGAADRIPASCHDDGTARVQTVTKTADPKLHGLLEAFGAAAGVPVLINTSFNRRGEPVVCSPSDALRVYLETEMDALVLGPFLLEKAGPA